MEVLGRAAAEHLGAPLASLDHVEVYSCFPAAVRVQQRALGLPVDGVPTITGGEPFAGGPWNNFVLQATVAMVELLRAHPGARGMVTTVSGFLNKPGLAVYSTEPAAQRAARRRPPGRRGGRDLDGTDARRAPRPGDDRRVHGRRRSARATGEPS